jgi:hypothetical protein
MAKAAAPSHAVVTANRLIDGAVVFQNQAGIWIEQIADAVVLEGAALDAAVEAGKASERRQEVVESYPVEVDVREGIPVPVRQRERVRALGPTIRTDLGKQAAGAHLPDADHDSAARPALGRTHKVEGSSR